MRNAKLTFLIIVLGCLCNSHFLLAQSGVYEMYIPEGSTVAHVLQRLSNNYKLEFAYPAQSFTGLKMAEKFVKRSSLSEFLHEIFKNEQVGFQLIDNTKVLLRKEDLAEKPLLLRGNVREASSGEALPYVAVFIDTLQIGTYTDNTGKYALEVPAHLEKHTLYFRLLGYETQKISVAEAKKSVDISLPVKPFEIGAIQIEDRQPIVQSGFMPGAIKVENFFVVQSSTLINDPLRAVQLLPGVSANNDLSADIAIRGGNADETLVVLDGIPIYNASHFYGVFSAFNSDYISSIEVYKHILPISYGGKTGGMLLIQSRENASDGRIHAQADVNLLTSSLTLSIPVNDLMGFRLSGRISNLNFAQSKFWDWMGDKTQATPELINEFTRNSLRETVPDFGFYDLHAKWSLTMGHGRRLDWNMYGSKDDFANGYEDIYTNRIRKVRTEEEFNHEETWENLGSSLNYSHSSYAGKVWEASIFMGDHSTETQIESSLLQTNPDESRVTTFSNEQYNRLTDWGARASLKFLNRRAKAQVHLGSEWIRHQNRYVFQIQEDEILNGEGIANEVTVFAAYRTPDDAKWHKHAGIRTTYYSGTNKVYLSPRLSLAYQPGSAWSLRAAFSRDYQFVREAVHESRLGQTIRFFSLSNAGSNPVGASYQYSLGFLLKKNRWKLDLEGYYKDVDNIVTNVLPQPGFDKGRESPNSNLNYKTFIGKGRIWGVDALLQYESPLYTGWIAYTLSKSTDRFKEIFNNSPFPSENDRRHQLKVINMFRWNRWSWSLNYIFTSGKPYSDLSQLQETRDRRILQPVELINRLPDYHRLDFGATYTLPLGEKKLIAGVSLFNVTNHKNVSYIQYIYSIPNPINRNVYQVIGAQTNLLDRTLNLSLKLEW